MKTKILAALAALLLTPTAPLHAQETLLGIGRVNSVGTLLSGACPVGTMTTSHLATGEYQITIDAPGQFVGAGTGDFLPQATTRTGAASDRALTGEVTEVTSDTLTAVFYLSDMEDSNNLSGPEPTNASFQFAILRFPSPGAASPPASRYLFASGSFAADGTLVRALTSDGSTVTIEKPGGGDYHLIFTKPGAFADTALGDFLPFATTAPVVPNQDNNPVGAADSKSADHVRISFNTADVQNPSDDNPSPEDSDVHFTIYRLANPGAAPESSLLLSMASIQGNGQIRRASHSLPGGNLNVQRTGPGRYHLILSAPGAFAGRTPEDFSFQAFLNNTRHIDRLIHVRPISIDGSAFTFLVRINDVENDGVNVGEAEDNDFFITVHDVVAKVQSDLTIGRTADPATMRGANLHNTNAAGQTLTFRPKRSGLVRFHLTTENEGNTLADLSLRGQPSKPLRKTLCLHLSGGGENVTASFRTTGHLNVGVRPTETRHYQVRSVLPPKGKKRRAAIRAFSHTNAAPVPHDSALAKVIRRHP